MHILYQIVDHCDLNCAGCDHGAPLATPWCVTPTQLQTDLTVLANTVRVDDVVLYGGEPLLHSQLPLLMTTVLQVCPHTALFIRTNGVKLKQWLANTAFTTALRVTSARLQVTEYPCTAGLIEQVNAQYPCLAEPSSRMCEETQTATKDKMYRLALHTPGDTWRSAAAQRKRCYCLCREVNSIRVRAGKAYPCPVTMCTSIAFNQFLPDAPDVGIPVATATAEQLQTLCTSPSAMCAWCADVEYNVPWAVSKRAASEWCAASKEDCHEPDHCN